MDEVILIMIKHLKWIRLCFFRFKVRVVIRVRVRVKYIIIVLYLYNKKHGNMYRLLYGTACGEQDSEAKVYGFKPWSEQQVS